MKLPLAPGRENLNAARMRLPVMALAIIALMPVLAGCGSSGPNASSGVATTPTAGNDGGPTHTTSAAPAAVAAVAAVASVELGEKVFKQRCVLCHGPEGRGNGPASAALKPNPPRNFHDRAYMTSRTDDQLLLSIHNGKNAMPPWKAILSEVEMKSALMFVRGFASQP